MTFALCLQIPNHLRFHRVVDIYANFIPQMIFLQSIFGYLVICILYKWSVDWSETSMDPPSLLNMLINMILKPGAVLPEEKFYAGQAGIQVILLGLAGICIPWLLITKPYIQWKEMQKIHSQGYVGLVYQGDAPPRTSGDLRAEEEGNGQAGAQEMEEEGVRVIHFQSSPIVSHSEVHLRVNSGGA